MTWEQMWDKAKLLTRKEGGVQYFGFGTNSSTIQGMNPLSIPLADPKTDTPTINKDERGNGSMTISTSSRTKYRAIRSG